MTNMHQKIVDFSMCKECKFFEKEENGFPCENCLGIPSRWGTNEPIHFEKVEERRASQETIKDRVKNIKRRYKK